MKITSNEIFKNFLIAYGLSENLDFQVDVPIKIKEILDDKIVVDQFGITIRSISNGLRKAEKELGENQSIVEDNSNHFHVDGYIQPADNKNAFMLGVTTLVLLAKKFANENIIGVRFWLSFQTPELGKKWEKANDLYEEGDDSQCISDRLSFYVRREGEEIISFSKKENFFLAILIIDI